MNTRISKRAAPSLTLIGAGSYSATIRELAQACGFHVVGYLDDDPGKLNQEIDGLGVSGPISSGILRLPRGHAVAVAIGDNDERLRWLREADKFGLATPKLISPQAHVSPSAKISDGVYLHPGSIAWAHAVLGRGTILSPNATVAHHTELGQSCFLSTGSSVGASISVGDAVMFGIGSTTSTGVRRVGSHGVIGAGAVVLRDTKPYGVYVGVPAKLLNQRLPMEDTENDDGGES